VWPHQQTEIPTTDTTTEQSKSPRPTDKGKAGMPVARSMTSIARRPRQTGVSVKINQLILKKSFFKKKYTHTHTLTHSHTHGIMRASLHLCLHALTDGPTMVLLATQNCINYFYILHLFCEIKKYRKGIQCSTFETKTSQKHHDTTHSKENRRKDV
jgi:hypothetical protein